MFPFWDLVIAPIIDAAGAKRIVEIGARRGATTERMLDRLGTQVELHVIDPVPDFDPAEHERRFPGRYFAHTDVSHNVLPTLPATDVALIDGDHNWYTVFHELQMLADAARRDGAPLPILILHDVCWPYGRRDLYYAPERIPDEFRQPHAQRGLMPGREGVEQGSGGLNATMHNALREGGPRNGVMTALDDFVAQYERPLRSVVIPIYFGLAIVAEQALVDRHPSLAAELDRLESALGKDALLELAEQTRLRALVHQRKEVGRRETLVEASAVRYLALLKRTLLDEVYIENEVRLQYLADCITKNRPVDETQLRDPVRYLKQQTAGLESVRATGALGDAAGTGASFLPYTDMGRARLDHLEHALDVIRREDIPGDLVDCSTGRGGGGIFMRGYLDAYQMPDRLVWVVDRFRVHARGAGLLDLGTDLNQVRDAFARFDVFDDRVRFVQGDYGETLKGAATGAIALLRIGADSDDAGAILERLYSRLAAGGFVVVDDYASPACRARVDEYRAAHGLTEPLDRIDASAVSWRKATSAPGAAPRAVGPRSRQTTVDLSVVVVFYNMRREAARTLHSLSRAYQEGLDGVAYEVIVVENGSAPDQKLGADYVTSFGPEFRYVDLADAARPSPVYALNHGAALATGKAVAFMIDGAHVLTPGVLRNGLLGLSAYEPSVVVTQQWYVGPGQQGDEMRTGYDQVFEDKLFDRIGWPSDGYRLFEIGHFIGDRDWLDGLWESNCIFATRALLDQLGVFDEAFSVAGGEYANLDFYERLVANPRTTMVSILGEGSFHQVHGGTTTNQLDTDGRRARIVSYAERYKDLRGRNYKGPGKTIHYIGSMRASALRTRARRMTGTAFRDARVDADATVSVPMPDQLRDEFIDAFWHTQAWRGTEWLGVTVERPASDLVAYQTVVARTRPDWIVVTGPRSGGLAWYLASLCDLVGHGAVLAVGAQDDVAVHDRIHVCPGRPSDAATAAAVHEIVGDGRALVVLGSVADRQTTMAEFELYHDLVPAGSYVVVEHTVVNGHPVWPEFGPGPLEAVKELLKRHGNFAVDPTVEQQVVTFNRMGFLKRLR